MRDPLILPLAAVIAGILVGRRLEFSPFEAVWPIVAFALLAAVARARWLRILCVELTLFCVGAGAEAWHRPGPRPEIDAGSREIVKLEGCVVEPSTFSSGREQFTLEIDPGARARVTRRLEGDKPDPYFQDGFQKDGLHEDGREPIPSSPSQRVFYGQRVEIEGRIRPPRNFQNPGAFDYVNYLGRQHIFWTVTVARGTDVTVLPGRCGSREWKALYALRGAALDRIVKLYPDDDASAGASDSGAYGSGAYDSGAYDSGAYDSGMLQAVLIGETAKLEKIWTVNFRRTGTFHALVISGTHVAVLAGVLLFLLRLCALPEMAALVITAGAAWLYALISGFTPPVARAAAGFTLYLMARFFFRRGRVLNLLAAVAIAFLLWDPSALFDASFQLSFLSVAAIGALAAPLMEMTIGPLARGLRGIHDLGADPHLEPRVAQFRVELRLFAETLHFWIRAPLQWCVAVLGYAFRMVFFGAEIVLISLMIQVGLALPMAEYFHRISFTGLSANLIIIPLLDALVPVGFLAIFTGWRWAGSLASCLLAMAARTADWHARLEPNWRLADPPWWLALGLVTSLLLFASMLTRWLNESQREKREHRKLGRDERGAEKSVAVRPRQERPREERPKEEKARPAPENTPHWPGWTRWRTALCWFTGGAVTALFALLLWQPWPARTVPHQLEVTSIDVGQGDSLLIIFPGGKRMMIDAGGILEFGTFPSGKPRRKPNLDIGEDVVSPYLWNRGIRSIDVLVATHAHEDHIGGAMAIMENFRPRELWVGANPSAALVQRARQLGVHVIEMRAPRTPGEKSDYSGAQLEVVSPPEDYVAAKVSNNDSLALRIVYGARSFLLTGDMESPMEQRLLFDRRLEHSDVLKIGHHGSKTSSTEAFLDAVSPSIALISAGFENSFGHPHPSVVQRLVERHTTILRTDLNGLQTVRSDGRRLWFDTMPWESETGHSAAWLALWSAPLRDQGMD